MSIRFAVSSLVRGSICIAFVTLAGCGSGGGDGTGTPTSVVDAAPAPGVATGSDLPTLRINEIVARNERSLDDEDGNAEDWLEIENTGTEAVDLAGIYLTDDADVLDQWAFGSGVLPGGERLVVFASSKDRSVAPYHTNFSLKGDGEASSL